MNKRLMMLVLLAVGLVVAGCAGDNGSSDQTVATGDPAGQSEDSGGSDQSAGEVDGGDSDAEGSGSDGGAPELDPSDMPPPGAVVLEVEGQTFTISADEMDYFVCDIGDDFVSVRSESGSQDLAVQVDRSAAGRGNATVSPAGSDVVYNSFYGPETTGGATVAAPHVVYEGPFDATNVDDINDISDVGTGRVSVTCP